MSDRAVSDNGAGFADAPCVAYYKVIRKGVPKTSHQLGYGVNKWPVPGAVLECLRRVYHVVLPDKVQEYDDGEDDRTRRLIVELLSRYCGIPDLDPDGVFAYHGSTEAISVAMGYIAKRGLRPVLPLPNYYAFEHSLRRHNAFEPIYYSAGGELGEQVVPAEERAMVDVAPNGVLGSWFTLPSIENIGLSVIDLPFSLPQLGVSSGRTYAEFLHDLRGRVPDREWAMCLTPSKDLSVPGLRVGCMVTPSPALQRYAQADRFERGYAPHTAAALVAAVHLGVVMLALAARDRDGHEEMRTLFDEFGVPFLDRTEAELLLTELSEVERHFQHNLKQLNEADLFVPVLAAEAPVAGYSTFRWLAGSFGGHDDFTRWINSVGKRGLKLNPNLLFGGDERSWTSVYPSLYGIRLNLSAPHAEVARNLTILSRELEPRR
ncbi:hypothetical protein [Streptomyces sp. NPDC088789]|uniref:hypothetical protein n=1 Tax=Streptomyces sp. NPDC088789 TaxID=3365899 RepID=UPI0037F1F58D